MATRRTLGALVCAAAVTAWLSPLAAAASTAKPRKPDLADVVEGAYFGAVISDSKGSSKSDVSITVTRVGANRVSIASDYARLPEETVRLTRATGKILNAGGTMVFFYDPAKSPAHLDVTFNNEVSWSGERR